jgi:hypothetical protein
MGLQYKPNKKGGGKLRDLQHSTFIHGSGYTPKSIDDCRSRVDESV